MGRLTEGERFYQSPHSSWLKMGVAAAETRVSSCFFHVKGTPWAGALVLAEFGPLFFSLKNLSYNNIPLKGRQMSYEKPAVTMICFVNDATGGEIMHFHFERFATQIVGAKSGTLWPA